MSQSAPAPELKTYNGNCHCGAFKYTAKLPELTSTYPCNCSICFRKGYRWLFPGPGCFTVTKGEGTLKEYRFGPKKMAHMFCGTCGTGVYGKNEDAPPGMDIAINVNTLQDPGVDVYDLKANDYDGKAIDPQYVPPKLAGTEPTAEFEDAKTYYGSCHCGAVTVAMKTDGPLTNGKQRILECDCSICTRYGTTLTYPIAAAFSVHTSSPNALTAYSFGRKFNEHMTCSTCGVSVYCHKKENIPADVWRKEKGEQTPEESRSHVPVNLRCFEGVEWEALREKGIIRRGRWSQVGGTYVPPE